MSESNDNNENNATHKEIIDKLPIRFISKVVKGFQRGSAELGIPTANLSREDTISSIPNYDDLPCGIYWGFARIIDNNDQEKMQIYKTAVSIGFNPYYKNDTKTVEPHLIASPDSPYRTKSSCQETILGEFYGKMIRLSLVGHLRPELPFDGLENLISAIKNDIRMAEELGENKKKEISTTNEKEWVGSEENIV